MTIKPLIGSWKTKCDACGTIYENGVGSTPCCGALQSIISDDVMTTSIQQRALNAMRLYIQKSNRGQAVSLQEVIADALTDQVAESDTERKAEVERLTNERNAWTDTAAFHSRNEDYYHGLLNQIGEMFGDAAKTQDDGGLVEDVLCIKVPKLVAAAMFERDSLHAQIADLTAQVEKLKADGAMQWTKEPPNDQGLYWWWNEDEDSAPIPVTIFYSGTDGSYFAPEGQWGWTRFQPVTEMGGVWIRLHEPSTAAMEASK